MNNAGLVERLQEHYRDQLPMAKRWTDATFQYSWRNAIGYYQRERVRRALVGMLNRHRVDLEDARILDIGCGTGDWLRFLAELRGTSHGLAGMELSMDSLRRAKSINGAITVVQGDARQLPFADGAFDVVSQFVTFEHLTDPVALEAACFEVQRVCAPDGWLIWEDLLPIRSNDQRGFTLSDVQDLFPAFRVVGSETIFRNYSLAGRTISTAYSIARRSHLLADLCERLVPGRPNNLLVLLRGHAAKA